MVRESISLSPAGRRDPRLLQDVLFLILGVPLAAFLAYSYMLRSERLTAFRSSSSFSVRFAYSASFILMAVLVVCLAKPYWGYQEVEVPASGRDVLAIVDVSRSMLAKDAYPSRLDLAKRKLNDLISLLEKQAIGDRDSRAEGQEGDPPAEGDGEHVDRVRHGCDP